MRYTVPLALLAVLLFVPPRPSDAEKKRVPRPPHPPYSLIRDTSSPSHRYVMAWSVKGKNVDWNLLENSHSERTRDYFWKDVLANENNVRNYIVDKKTKRVLGIVPMHSRELNTDRYLSPYTGGGDYWTSKNHAEVSTYWTTDESMAVLFYDAKWWFDAIYIAERVSNKFRMIEVGELVESHLRRYLDRTKHRAYQAAHTADNRNPTVEAGNFRLTRNSLTMDVRAYIPKTTEDPAAFRYYGTMRLALIHAKGGIQAHVVSLKQRPRKPDED